MNTELLDNIDPNNNKSGFILEALSWWEKKRLWFNILVGLAGFIPILIFPHNLKLADFVGIVIYGVLLNILYSLGFLIEAWNSYYFNNKIPTSVLRYPLFILGTVVTIIITTVWMILFCSFQLGTV